MSEETRQSALQNLVEISLKMGNIVDALLLLAEVRKREVVLSPLDMGEIVRQAQKRLADLILQSQAEIILPETWPAALGYAPWVEEVWVNYLSNGCKYGGKPPHLRLTGETLAGTVARFWICDDGDGISPVEQQRLFAPFTRLDEARLAGYGLGLSIVQRIVEKLGGQAGVESEGVPGYGSRFFFTLPAAGLPSPITKAAPEGAPP